MRKLLLIFLFSITAVAFGQAKYALIIGNSNYTNFGTLRNPVNDANDMAAALANLGFTVDKVINGSLNQMENASIRLKERLISAGNDAYGFFYYAGHGLEMGGVNYLIPTDADIPDRSFLRERAFSVQIMLDMLNDTRDALNIVVLDACRDFPATWSRSLDRGLTFITNPPANHIIMYATGAGMVASDGNNSRNGLFTSYLLHNLQQPGIDVNGFSGRRWAMLPMQPIMRSVLHCTRILPKLYILVQNQLQRNRRQFLSRKNWQHRFDLFRINLRQSWK
ncbi:MAG: caspase family protein [Treponema sp.]|nr:caspase family protein [Treponema sp.]